MSSVTRGLKNTEQGNAYFMNIVTLCRYDFRKADGTPLEDSEMSEVLRDADTASAGQMTVRDLGKTVRLSAPLASGVSHCNRQRILRLVQRVDYPAATLTTNTVAGTNEGVGGSATKDVNGYETFYIELSAVANGSYGGKWVRVSVA